MAQDLRQGIFGGTIPAGTIFDYVGNTAPAGWAICDGALVNVVDNPLLNSIMGNRYGGDGVNTIGLPDLRGFMTFGLKAGDPDFPTFTSTSGVRRINWNHQHSQNNTGNAGSHNHGGATGTPHGESGIGNFGRGAGATTEPTFPIASETDHAHTNPATDFTGNTTELVLPPYKVFHKIIKLG